MVRYVRSVLARREGRPVDEQEAADVVQDYLTQALEKGWLARDAEAIRCFRAYLQAQLSNFAVSYLRRKYAQKRSPRRLAPPEILERVEASASEGEAAELDAGWVDAVTQEVLQKLRELNATYHAVIVDLLHTHGEGSADLAAQLGCPPSRLKGLRHRARRRLAVLFFQEMRLSVRDEEAYETLFERLAPHLP